MPDKSDKNLQNLFNLIALSRVNGLGTVNIKRMLNYFGDLNAILTAKQQTLQKVEGIGAITAKKIISGIEEGKKTAEKELKFIEKYNINFVCITDKDYPVLLQQCEDAPLFLFYKGQINFNRKYISIVGTRKNTRYGKTNCETLISDLKENGHNPVIVSGLAYGTDICAHKSALKNELKTIAVLGHGLDRIYPSQHTKTAKEIIENGALLTEFLSGTNPDRQNFVRRNRIIAGISECTVVVESGEKGGSLITADIANSYNRDVFAFPGNTNSSQSKGCNKLIKTHKASLIENVADIEYVMGWNPNNKNKQLSLEIPVDLNEEESKIYNIIKSEQSINIDVLSRKSGMIISELSIILFNLELNGFIKSYPGNLYKIN